MSFDPCGVMSRSGTGRAPQFESSPRDWPAAGLTGEPACPDLGLYPGLGTTISQWPQSHNSDHSLRVLGDAKETAPVASACRSLRQKRWSCIGWPTITGKNLEEKMRCAWAIAR